MDVTEITAVRSGVRHRVRTAIAHRSGPPSLGAQLALTAGAFLLGAVIAGLLFVGAWRHTAAEGDVARAEQHEVAQRLQIATAKVETLARAAAAARADAARAAQRVRTTRERLGALDRRDRRVASGVAAGADGLAGAAADLERRTTKLRSALASISDYLAGGSAVDPAFVQAQIRYVMASAAEAGSNASSVAADAARVQSAAAALRRRP
jgi:hypothetical protein